MPPIILGCSVNLLAGAPGTGKSAFLAYWIQRCLLGEPIFGVAPPELPLYQAFITADRSWDMSTRRWFDVQGLDADTFPHYSLQDDKAFRKARLRKKSDRIAIFNDCLDALQPDKSPNEPFPARSLIYVDPLALFLGGNLIDYDACLVACSELREICQERNVTIIGTAHAAKQKADKAERYLRLQDRILGSAALFGYTDTQFYLASPEETGAEDGHYQFLWHPHHAPAQLFPLTRDSEGRFVPVQVHPKVASHHLPPEDADWLLEALAKPLRSMDLIALGRERSPIMSRATIHRRLDALRASGQIQQVKHGVWQRLTPS